MIKLKNILRLKTLSTPFANCYLLIVICFCASGAHAAEFKISGYGTAGMIDPNFDNPLFIGDFRVNATGSLAVADGQKIGAVYAYDELALESRKYARDAFAFYENSDFGRIELGITSSVARKFGVGLPDVGGLRINDKPIFLKKIPGNGNVISDVIFNTGRHAPRINFATTKIGNWQYGASMAAFSDTFDYTADVGLKYRQSAGKTKTAVSFGASFTDALHNHRTEHTATKTTADWRAQGYVGLNIQYNSWLVGTTFRATYDKNAITPPTDGIAVGAGVSYDLLKYSVSASYMFSDTGIWTDEFEDYRAHSALASFRYKYSPNFDFWMSLGITTDTPFLSAALRLTF